MGKRKKRPALCDEMRDVILQELARRAAAGNTAAARLYLEEYRAAHEGQADSANAIILSLADLINNPEPDRDIEDL